MNANDSLDRRLLEDAARELPDDGFTRRVLAALPAPAPRPARWRAFLILGSAALGALLATALGGLGASLAAGFADLALARSVTPAASAVLALGLTLAVTATVLVADSD